MCMVPKESPIEGGSELGFLARKLIAGSVPPIAGDLHLHAPSPKSLCHHRVTPPAEELFKLLPVLFVSDREGGWKLLYVFLEVFSVGELFKVPH